MRVALDTNVLIYGEAADTSPRAKRALEIFARLTPKSTVVSVVALSEFFHVLTRGGRYRREQADAAVARWRGLAEIASFTGDQLVRAGGLAVRHQLAIWDAVQMVAAEEAGCEALLTEDLQDGFRWGPLLVANLFLEERWRWLQARLAD